LIPLIETGPGEDNDCKALIASAKQPLKSEKQKEKKAKAEGPEVKKP
jgi:hypothetical protein